LTKAGFCFILDWSSSQNTQNWGQGTTNSRAILQLQTTRFAPSPTGYLHLGHIVSAMFVWTAARRYGAQVLLRFEDHDRQRCRMEFEDATMRDLEWLGFLAPSITGVNILQVSRQSERQSRYDEVFENLSTKSFIYFCSCSRKDQLSRGLGGGDELKYDQLCRERNLKPEARLNARFKCSDSEVKFDDLILKQTIAQNPVDQCGDFVVRDRHGNYSYQFAATVDDMDQGVDLVVRGQDILSSTARQIQLRDVLSNGRGADIRFGHHNLLLESGGQKLSKRSFSESILARRQQGDTPETLIAESLQAMAVSYGAVFGAKSIDLLGALETLENYW
jgi:glutamyl-Q tRNA(Asp) synthetase